MKYHFSLFIIILILFCFSGWGCKAEVPATPDTSSTDTIVKGADISWLPQMEASGYKFYNNSGVHEDCFSILKEHGINSIRLRTWVSPSNDPVNGHCSQSETVAVALRAKNNGMRIMIDFHYSDSWADPSKQVKPTVGQVLTSNN